MNQFSDGFSHNFLAAYSCLESGYVCKSQYRDIKSVTEFQSGCFSCCSCGKSAVEFFCLLTFCIVNFCSVSHCTYSHSVYTKESCNNVFAEVSLGLEEDSVVCDSGKCDGGISCACCDILACTVQIICALCERIIVFEVGWKKAYKLTDLSKDLFFRFYSIDKSCLLALESSGCCVTFLCVVSIKCVRAVYEHFAFFGFDECEISQCRNNCHSSATGTEYRCDLRDHSGCHCLFEVDSTECFQCICCFLKTHSCTIYQSDHRCSCFDSKVI